MKWLKNLFKKKGAKKKEFEPVCCLDCEHLGETVGVEANNFNGRLCNFYTTRKMDYSDGRKIVSNAYCISYNKKGTCKAFEEVHENTKILRKSVKRLAGEKISFYIGRAFGEITDVQ